MLAKPKSLVIACGITPIERRTPSACFTTSKPATFAVPVVGSSSVVSMRISVDLPAPFGPSRPKISPCSTSNDTSSSARVSPSFLPWRKAAVPARKTKAGAQKCVIQRVKKTP